MIIKEEDYIKHYGIPRKSGRYPWGSGDNPYQNSKSFLGMVKDLSDQGLSQTEIAQAMGMTTTELRQRKTISRNEVKQGDIAMAQRLKDRGWSNVAIGERMGINESSVRNLLKPSERDKANILDSTANMLKEQVDQKGLIDIGVGVERQAPLGISKDKFNTAVAKLVEDEGYKRHYVKVPQLGTDKHTTMVVLSRPDVPYSEVYKNRFDVKLISEHTEDGGRTWLGIDPPVSIKSDRVKINYAEEGGADADGVIFVRPGVDDVSLGGSQYAQVRIAVDGTHFIKGMAVYKSDLPAGSDLVFNTNKSRAEAPNKLDALKPMQRDRDGNIDQDNPFGASISRQSGVMNVLREEGDWAGWNKALSSQMLSKQSPKLAKSQLDLTFERKNQELDEIISLTNPVVKRTLLDAFSGDADSSAGKLDAAAMPRQSNSVLLPVPEMKSTEIYAPNYKNGERVVLVRHPHGGIFEIPELTVNNRNQAAKKLIGNNASDAVGINPSVAERLSGADFDGDTVLVIPNDRGSVKTAPALEGLKDFDPRRAYPSFEGMKPMTSVGTQRQMGDVSNLITDMTLKGANSTELARAVRHSMVVIDAEKHKLNYKQSALDNGIPQLKEKYQGRKNAGASTVVSLARSQEPVFDRKPRPASDGGPIDRKTGELVFVPTGKTRPDGRGGETPVKIRSTKMRETRDAHTLSSGTPMEKLYADHANKLKGLANRARLEMINTKNTPYSPSAKAAYSNEVTSLKAKLNVALMNAPRERQAQLVANGVVAKKREANPGMDHETLKKVKNQALTEARTRTGAAKDRIDITPKEWEAIQSGAISNNMLEDILRNTDLDRVKEYATPRDRPAITAAAEARAKAMAAAGFTQAEIAGQLGVSVSSITNILS